MGDSKQRQRTNGLAGLRTRLIGRLVTPGDPTYDDARIGWNPRFTSFPLAVAYCRSADDVITSVRWAREHDVALRIRSGGHSLEGWSLIDGGLIVDVSAMTDVRINERDRVATVQTGILVGDLLAALAPKGLTVPFGDSTSVGIGGITLGGGIGVLGRSMGLICDNLIGVEMVIASGARDAELIRATEEENADLLWACRGGGGGNFGVATMFTFALHPVPAKVAIFDVYWPWADAEGVLESWQTTAPAADERLGSMLELFSTSVGKHRMHGLYLGSEAELSDHLQPLLSVGTPDINLRTVPYLEATRFLTDAPTARHQADRAPLSIKFSSAWASAPLSKEAVALSREYLEQTAADAYSMFFLSMGGAVSRRAPHATAFPHRQASFYLEWDARWTHPEQVGLATLAVEQMRLTMQPFVSGSYVNVPDPSIGDWQRAYYGDNAARLCRLKRRYDPQNVFNFAQSIPAAAPEEH